MSDVKLFKVGGCVRDQFLGRKCKDVDFAVLAANFSTMKAFVTDLPDAEVFDVPLTAERCLTVKAKVPHLGGVADFTLCRKERGYADGRHPDTIEVGTLFEDQSRRDLTINSMALCMDTGTLFDPFDGRGDLDRKMIRAVGNAHDRVDEDQLRLLRALRFACVLDFTLHDDFVMLLNDPVVVARMMQTVSADRVREEVSKMFASDTLRAMALFARFPIVRDAVFGDGSLWMQVTSAKH